MQTSNDTLRFRFLSHTALLAGLAFGGSRATADIYQWEWVDPNDPSQGKRQSSTLCPDGAGLSLGPAPLFWLWDSPYDWRGKNLSQAYLINADLTRIWAATALLSDADMSGAELGGAVFAGADLTNVTMRDARIAGVHGFGPFTTRTSFANTTAHGFTAEQLYSTQSYAAGTLTLIDFSKNDLRGWSFAGKTIAGSDFSHSMLAGADFSGAELGSFIGLPHRETSFNSTTTNGFTANQLYATASYQRRFLQHLQLEDNDLGGWDFSNQDLYGASFARSNLTGTAFAGARVDGVDFSESQGFSSSQLYSTASYQQRNLEHVGLQNLNLSGWNFSNQVLYGAEFRDSDLTGADFTNADISSADFSGATTHGFTAAQLYSTASYKSGKLSVDLSYNDLRGWDFSSKQLDGASFARCDLTGAKFDDASIFWTSFAYSTGFSLEQLYSTASYKNRNLHLVDLAGLDLENLDFRNQYGRSVGFSGANLRNASFVGAYLQHASFGGAVVDGADFSFTDLRGSWGLDVSGLAHRSAILPDGTMQNIEIHDGERLIIRAYSNGSDNRIHVLDGMNMDGGTLEFLLEPLWDWETHWSSTIGFEAGAVVMLGGTLLLKLEPHSDINSLAGISWQLFDWTGVTPIGSFNIISADPAWIWDTSNLYTTGYVTLVAVPEPALTGLLALAALRLAGRSGRVLARQHRPEARQTGLRSSMAS